MGIDDPCTHLHWWVAPTNSVGWGTCRDCGELVPLDDLLNITADAVAKLTSEVRELTRISREVRDRYRLTQFKMAVLTELASLAKARGEDRVWVIGAVVEAWDQPDKWWRRREKFTLDLWLIDLRKFIAEKKARREYRGEI